VSGIRLPLRPVAIPVSQLLFRKPLAPFQFALQPLSERIPVLLFPVRLETRFLSGQLQVRIYPDQLCVEAHEIQLTRGEVASGLIFRKRYDAAADDIGRRDAWRLLADEFGSPRAAWIARQLSQYEQLPSAQLPVENVTPPTVRLLPDQFAVTLYKDGKPVITKTGARITGELPLMRGLQGGADNSDLFDDGSRWVWDYERAVKAGMAVTIPLTPELQPPFSHVVVVGLRQSLTPKGAAGLIESWIEGQHYTSGFEFLEYGTPTNNTADVKSGYSESHDKPDDTFLVEMREQDVTAEPSRSNSGRLRRALGLLNTSTVFSHIRSAGLSAESYVTEFQTALWPATGGYFLDAMLGRSTSADGRDLVAGHFAQYVRARGPYAALRIGRIPYGVLPVTQLSGWMADISDAPPPANTLAILPFLTRLQRAASGLFGRFYQLATRLEAPQAPAPVPRIGGTSDPDSDLLRVLAMEPRSTSWNQRRFVDERMAGMLLLFLRHQFGPVDKANSWAQGWVTASEATRQPTIDLLSELGAQSQVAAQETLLHVLGWSESFPLTAPLTDTASLQTLAAQGSAAPATASPSILYQLLHRALRGTNGAAVQNAIKAFVSAPTPDVEGLTRDVLDLCSHRLDAWITSLATRRLEAMRSALPAESGIHIGTYGWVENLSPAVLAAPPAAGVPAAGTPAPGYIHAPSVGQAAAAAVIRNGFLSHPQTPGNQTATNPFQTDVSSDRVRLGMALLDGVRQGQPLAGLLGFQFERGLHELQLDRYIDDFRRDSPLVAHTEVAPTSSTETAEAVAARNVVDGMQLAEKWRLRTLDLGRLVHESTPSAAQTVTTALRIQLDLLRNALDAVGDLLLTESVYHAVQGNYDRSGAALDAAAGAGPPPEIDSVRTPVPGQGLRHRVCLLLPPAGSPTGAGPRTRAEPRLAAWVATLFSDVAGIPITATITKTLAELGLDPIDLLYMSGQPPEGDETELERWLRFRAGTGAAPLALSQPGGIADLLERARHIMAFVAESAPLRADALARPETAPDPVFTDAVIGQLQNRVRDAQLELEQVTTKLNPKATTSPADVVAALLLAARFGVSGAVPTAAAEPELAQRREAVYAETSRRLADSRELYAPPPAALPSGTADTRMQRAQDAMKALFGDGFTVLPVFSAPDSAALTSALQQNGRLSVEEGEPRVELWLQQAAEIHKPVRRLEDLLMIGRACTGGTDGTGPLALGVAQLPFCDARPWQALSDDEIASRAGDATTATGECVPAPVGRPRAVLSLVIVKPRSDGIDLNDLAGLLVDQWTEVIPNSEITTGVSFQYDAPGSQAPQALLLAVPGHFTPAGVWTTDQLRDIVKETLDLAKVRLVDPDALQGVGGLLPGLFISTTPDRFATAANVVVPDLRQLAAVMPTVG
jgi:hypothetical protein